MKSFKHFRPESINEVVSILKKYNGNAKAVAGGTDLFGGLKDEIHPIGPTALVDLKANKNCAYIRLEKDDVCIGTLTKLRDIETNSIINQKYPLLAQAAKAVASPQIRNMATLGGNICQEPRCWYYRNPENTFECHRKGGSRCNALLGDNRFHSIFGAVRVVSSPCNSACPAGTAIPEYLEKFRAGDVKHSASILLRFNPLSAITGRVCPHFCQSGCNRSLMDTPVSVRNIERFVGDYILENKSTLMSAPANEINKKVAVIGAGPGGLSAAYFLRRAGYRVTVFDKMQKPGGMLTYAIPSYRLAKSVVQETISAIVDTGVEFRLNVNIGKDIHFDQLKDEYDAILLATGAWAPISIDLTGEDLAVSGLDFLKKHNSGNLHGVGKRVLVIGGGNVAVDVAITAKRRGADEVMIACLEKRDKMPCLEWEIEAALEEDIQLLNSWGPKELQKKHENEIETKLIQCVSVLNSKHRFDPKFDTTVVKSLVVDQVILAVGQKTDLSYLKTNNTSVDKNGLIEVDSDTQATNMVNIYACGDATTGPATVVEAIASGRRAAESINQNLTKETVRIQPTHPGPGELLNFTPECLGLSETTLMPTIELADRGLEFEDALGLEKIAVINEVKRCFNCGCVAVSPSDMAPALMALDAKVITTKRTIPVEAFFQAGLMSSTVLDNDELVIELRIPPHNSNTGQIYLKYRLRNAIDFPIASVAIFVEIDKNRVSKVRIVLGAAAPIPLRARAAEDIVHNTDLNNQVVNEACGAAIATATPLAGNLYKLNIFKALVKRALLELRTNLFNSNFF